MKKKQEMYKTAYSPLYRQFVRLNHAWKNGDTWYYYSEIKWDGEIVPMRFSEKELTNFCL